MNNIDRYIQELETAKVEMKDAIIAKGVTPEGGLSSYAAAIESITIPNPTFEELSVQLSENGTYNYTPTEDGYSSVEVTVDVEIPTFNTQIKDVTITSNGETIVTPDSGFDGLNEVNISVEVPIPTFETETLSVQLSENGTYNYTPTEDGYSSVEVVVDVASLGGGGVDLTTIGYSADVNNAYNAHMTDGIAYAQTIAAEYNGITGTSGNAKYKDDTNLVYFPVLNTYFSDASYMFQNCTDLEIANLNIKKTMYDNKANAMYCFADCSSLKSVKITGNMIDPAFAFQNCVNLTETTINMITHDDSNNDYCSYNNCFENCYKLETFPTTVYVSGYRGINLTRMFKNCKKMVTAPTFNYGSYYTPNSYTMDEMFYGCESLLQIPKMDRANYATNLQSMFEGCASLVGTAKYYNISPNSATYGDINLSRCFYGCASLTVAPIVGSTDRNTTANEMYYGCTALTTPFETYNYVTNAERMYFSCSNLTQMTTSTIDLRRCTNVNYMFGHCKKLKWVGNYGAGTFANLGMVENLTGTNTMFYNCSALTSGALTSIINGLYDRATAGYSVLTIQFHATPFALLTDDLITAATNKGWTISK